MPYTHIALCEDGRLFQVMPLQLNSCRTNMSPPALNHMNLCHKNHIADLSHQAYSNIAPSWAHKTDWGNPGGRSHMGYNHLGGTGSNNRTHNGHKKDLKRKMREWVRGSERLRTWESWDLLRELNIFLKLSDACFTSSIYPHSAGVYVCACVCMCMCEFVKERWWVSV